MSGKKSKRNKYQKPTRHEHPEGSDKLDSKPDHVAVTGKIEAGLSPNLIEKYDAASDKQESWDRKRFKGEIVTIVLLFTYTTVAFWQGCSNKRAADAAAYAADIGREALESVQRPFVAFQGTQHTQLSQHDKSGESLILTFYALLENTGTTPAKGIAQMFTGDRLTDEPSEEQFIKGTGISPSYILGPKSPYNFGRVAKPVTFFIPTIPSDMSAIRLQEVTGPRMFFWGWISYRDIFPRTPVHITEWCQVVTGITGQANTSGFGPKVSYDFILDNCKQHNCADESCPDYPQVAARAPTSP